MTKPISIAIRDLKTQVLAAINDSQLPPCIVEPVLNSIYQQIVQATQTELKAAEKQLAESEESE